MSYESGDWARAREALSTGEHVLLWGPPGTGKSYAAKTRNGDTFYSLALTPELPAAELRGHYVLTTGETRPAAGSPEWSRLLEGVPTDERAAHIAGLYAASGGGRYVWSDGPAIRAWREGTRFVCDELAKAGDDVEAFLHDVTDDFAVARISLPNGDTVKPADGFQFVGTLNDSPDILAEPIRDRCLAVYIGDPNPDGIMTLPEEYRDLAWNLGRTTDDRRVSLRAMVRIVRMADKVGKRRAFTLELGEERGGEVFDALTIGGA